MHITAIANQKGGCGKTTTTINLAAELGRRDRSVLVIDLDPQGHASLGMGVGDRDLPGLYEVFSDEAGFHDVVLHDVCEKVDLVPANISLAMLESLLGDEQGRERLLLEQLERFACLYDNILIDCPPSLGLLSINALRAADETELARTDTTEDNAMTQQAEQARRQMVVLTFDEIDCQRLQIAGDFNDWVPDRNIETRHINGHWQKVFTAEPGVYEYRLLIDGEWQPDPTNPAEIPNELGGVNSLLQVPVQH